MPEFILPCSYWSTCWVPALDTRYISPSKEKIFVIVFNRKRILSPPHEYQCMERAYTFSFPISVSLCLSFPLSPFKIISWIFLKFVFLMFRKENQFLLGVPSINCVCQPALRVFPLPLSVTIYRLSPRKKKTLVADKGCLENIVRSLYFHSFLCGDEREPVCSQDAVRVYTSMRAQLFRFVYHNISDHRVQSSENFLSLRIG